MMSGFEDVEVRAKKLADTYQYLGVTPSVRLPLASVRDDLNVTSYESLGDHDAWDIGSLSLPKADLYEKPRNLKSLTYVTDDGQIACLWPSRVTISTGCESSGWPAQQVEVLFLRKLEERLLDRSHIHSLLSALNKAMHTA